MHWILAHLIGDYLLQDDWMAKGKKESWNIAVAHTLAYMIPFLFVDDINIIKFILIAIQHLVQDRTNFIVWFMKFKGSEEFAQPPMAPWSIIITDNIFHILWIAFIMNINI